LLSRGFPALLATEFQHLTSHLREVVNKLKVAMYQFKNQRISTSGSNSHHNARFPSIELISALPLALEPKAG